MTSNPTTTETHARVSAPLDRRSGRWLDGWDPEDHVQWEGEGRRIARRNLGISVLAEFLGFGVFALWGIVVPQLAAYGYTGERALSDAQQFWLVSIPVLIGATLRIPYTFAVPRFGGRNWTIFSALILLLPTVALALAVETSAGFPVLLGVAALAGFGGGNFASSMTNISFFYPHAEKGKALGFNAAGGNLGTAAVQLVVPMVVVLGSATTSNPNLPMAGWIFVPPILVAAWLAWRWMDNLSTATSDVRSLAVAARRRHTWILSFLYIGTFGSFIGFAGAFPKLMSDAFPEQGLSLAFLGALVGSLSRPLGGLLADRVGGGIVTIVSLVAMAVGAVGAVGSLRENDFALFLGSFLLLFVFTGVGNGSVYRMIPAVFRSTEAGGDGIGTVRLSAGAIGIVGAIGAFGGFLVPQGFSASSSIAGSLEPALWATAAVYVVMALVTWAIYVRRGGLVGARI